VFDADRNVVLDRAHAVGVRAVVLPGVSSARWGFAASLGQPMCVGIHPEWIATEQTTADALRTAAQTHGAVGIGEFGLDVRVGGPDGALAQIEQCEIHLDVAHELDLPIVLHVVRRHGAMLELLRKTERGMVHGFTAAPEVALDYVRHGLHVSFGPRVCDERSKKARAAAQVVPLDRLLVETDAPHAKGARGEPADLVDVIDALASLREEEASAIAEATAHNARTLFGLR
jgi:TatD DNase family protein